MREGQMLALIFFFVWQSGQNQPQLPDMSLAKQLDAAVRTIVPGKVGTFGFAKLMTRDKARRARELYSTAPHSSPVRVETAFVMAYFDQHYEENMKVLVGPFDYKEDPSGSVWDRFRGDPAYDELIADQDRAHYLAESFLVILYEKFGRTGTLSLLVNLNADASDGETLTGLLQKYWADHTGDMFRCATRSDNGPRNIAAMLIDAYSTSPQLQKRRYRLRTSSILIHWTQNSNRYIAAVARRVLADFKDMLKTYP